VLIFGGVSFFMKSLRIAVKDFLNAQTIEGTQPSLCWCNTLKKWRVSYYFKQSTLNHLGWEVIL